MIVRSPVAVAVAAVLGLSLTAVAGCTDSRDDRGLLPPPSPPPAPDVPAASPPSGCPVTRPTPHPTVRLPGNELVSNPGVPQKAFGNRYLWVEPSEDGTLPASHQRSGLYWGKVPWWRVVPGQLVVEANRIDGPYTYRQDPGLVSEYGSTGFVPASLGFSHPGCWRITGRIGNGSLTFYARVVID